MSALVFLLNIFRLARTRHYAKSYIENISNEYPANAFKNKFFTIALKKLFKCAHVYIHGDMRETITSKYNIEQYLIEFDNAQSHFYQRCVRSPIWIIDLIDMIPLRLPRRCPKYLSIFIKAVSFIASTFAADIIIRLADRYGIVPGFVEKIGNLLEWLLPSIFGG